MAKVRYNSGNHEWYTPARFVDAARAVMGGIDLDPASSDVANLTVQARYYFTVEDDALTQEWPVGRIWMNPPFASRSVKAFCARFLTELDRGSSGCVLINNGTETRWFQDMAARASAISFPQSRIRFIAPDGSVGSTALQGQAIFYFGPDVDLFALTFAEFGRVMTTMI